MPRSCSSPNKPEFLEQSTFFQVPQRGLMCSQIWEPMAPILKGPSQPRLRPYLIAEEKGLWGHTRSWSWQSWSCSPCPLFLGRRSRPGENTAGFGAGLDARAPASFLHGIPLSSWLLQNRVGTIHLASHVGDHIRPNWNETGSRDLSSYRILFFAFVFNSKKLISKNNYIPLFPSIVIFHQRSSKKNQSCLLRFMSWVLF